MAIKDVLEGEAADQQREAQRQAADGGGDGRLMREPLDPVAAAAVHEARRMAEEEAERNSPGLRSRLAMNDRQPFGAGEQTLGYPDIPGYRLYWFSDTPGRIQRAKRAGYEHVLEEGTPVTRIVGQGAQGSGGVQGFLMMIPMEWYKDDVAAANDAQRRKMEDIKYGRLLQPAGTDGQLQYVPTQRGGIKIDERRGGR